MNRAYCWSWAGMIPLACLIACSPKNVRKADAFDHYRNFQELAKERVEGRDYSITIRKAPSKNLVMAFHGGAIEPGTTELANEVAGTTINFYTFQSLIHESKKDPSFTSDTLHITSAHFDEPQLLALTKVADTCLALHGFGGNEADFCVGGANESLRKKTIQMLSTQFPEWKTCELCCAPYDGVAKHNPVNRCENQGVQIEMSPEVRKEILSNTQLKTKLAHNLQQLFI